ncbi:hypothetical protein ACFOY2_22875 [Nonomuraea purpurea]|uniref:Uncharacterized protein n=1 Tax=Nonomuraea purpurea TaxID=1849276 RepID=A0ABV8GAI3_9ACTN
MVALITFAINPGLGRKIFIWKRSRSDAPQPSEGRLETARWWSIAALIVLAVGLFLYNDSVTQDPARLAAMEEQQRQKQRAAEQAERDKETEQAIKDDKARELGVEPGPDELSGRIVGYSADSDKSSMTVIYTVSRCPGLQRQTMDESADQIKVRIVEELRCVDDLPDTSVPKIGVFRLDAPAGLRKITLWDGAEIPRCDADPERAKACDVRARERDSKIKKGEIRELRLKPESDRLSGRIIGYRHPADGYGNVEDRTLTIIYTVSPCTFRGGNAVEEKAGEVVVRVFEEKERGGERLDGECANRADDEARPQRTSIYLDEPLGDRRPVVRGGGEIPKCDADPRRKRQCAAVK